MFDVLRESGALARVAAELDALWDDPDAARAAIDALDDAARHGATLPARFATLARWLEPMAVESVCHRLKVPSDCRDLALLASRHANTVLDAPELDAEALLELFDTVDAWRRPERFAELTTAAFAGEPETDTARARARLERALKAAAGIDAGAIARAAKGTAEIRGGIEAARLEAIRKILAGP